MTWARRTWLDVAPVVLHEVRLNGRALDVASCRRSDRAARPGRGQRGRGRPRDDGLQPRRPGPAPQRSTPPTARHYVYGHAFLDAAPRMFALLRPARPQGALHRRRGTAPAEWTVARQRRGDAYRAGPHGRWRPPRRWRRTSSRSAPGPTSPSRRARRHPAGRPRAALAASRTGPAGRRRCFTLTRQCFDHYHGCSASGTRSASTTRCSSRSSTPARWRTPAA